MVKNSFVYVVVQEIEFCIGIQFKFEGFVVYFFIDDQKVFVYCYMQVIGRFFVKGKGVYVVVFFVKGGQGQLFELKVNYEFVVFYYVVVQKFKEMDVFFVFNMIEVYDVCIQLVVLQGVNSEVFDCCFLEVFDGIGYVYVYCIWCWLFFGVVVCVQNEFVGVGIEYEVVGLFGYFCLYQYQVASQFERDMDGYGGKLFSIEELWWCYLFLFYYRVWYWEWGCII